MKYNTPILLYYVDPFIFIIEQVFIDFSYKEDDTIFYISKEGAYLQESNLFETLVEARMDALKKLDKFYIEKQQEILYSKPRPEDDN